MLHYASPAGVWNLCCQQRYSLPSLVSAKISSQAKCGMSHLSYTEIAINQSACLFSNQFLLLQKPFTIILSDLGWWPQRRFTEIISDVTHSTINFPPCRESFYFSPHFLITQTGRDRWPLPSAGYCQASSRYCHQVLAHRNLLHDLLH